MPDHTEMPLSAQFVLYVQVSPVPSASKGYAVQKVSIYCMRSFLFCQGVNFPPLFPLSVAAVLFSNFSVKMTKWAVTLNR